MQAATAAAAATRSANHKKVFSNLDAFDVVSETDSSSSSSSVSSSDFDVECSVSGPPLKSRSMLLLLLLLLCFFPEYRTLRSWLLIAQLEGMMREDCLPLCLPLPLCPLLLV